jgi:hypothetical protein
MPSAALGKHEPANHEWKRNEHGVRKIDPHRQENQEHEVWEGEPLPVEIHKSLEYNKWKAESMTAWLSIHFDRPIAFELPRETYEVASDFESCRDTSMVLSRILPLRPTIGVFGDRTGAASIACWAYLTPERVVQVVYQDVDQQAVSDENVRAFVAQNAVELHAGGSSTHKYQQYMSDHALWDTATASSHNSHPWEYFKNLAAYWSKRGEASQLNNRRHFDVIICEDPWNNKLQEKRLKIKGEMADINPEINYDRPRDELDNDLLFYDHETSPLAAMKFMDQFVLQPLFAAGATCDVIVCKIRGTVSDADWATLQKGGSDLATNYTLTFQIEELPNTRDNRMKFNSHTNSHDVFFEDHTPKYLDGNRGVRGKFHILIFQKNVTGQTRSKNERCYRRRPWYGPFFCCCDSTKQAIYVRTDTCEVPFQRISQETALEVIYKQAWGKLTPAEQDEYFKVDALRRKIDVQITDLTFLIDTFKNYISNYEHGTPIAESTTRDIKKYLAQAMYTYKPNDCVNSQSDKTDSHDKRIVGSGQALIDHKIKLYYDVKHYMGQIMHHNKWTFPPDPDLPWTPHRPFLDSIQWHVECELPHLHSEMFRLDMDWTLGDADCTMVDGVHRNEYEERARNGTISADETQKYIDKFGHHPKDSHGGGKGQTRNENGQIVRYGKKGKEYVQGGQNGQSYGTTNAHWKNHDTGPYGDEDSGDDDENDDEDYDDDDDDDFGQGNGVQGKRKSHRHSSDDEEPEPEEKDRPMDPIEDNDWD